MSPAEVRRQAEHAFPLALARRGELVRIAAIRAGKGLERRLYDIGLPVGSEIEIVLREGAGRMVVGCGNTRVALGSGMAQKIMVVLPAAAGGCVGSARAAE